MSYSTLGQAGHTETEILSAQYIQEQCKDEWGAITRAVGKIMKTAQGRKYFEIMPYEELGECAPFVTRGNAATVAYVPNGDLATLHAGAASIIRRAEEDLHAASRDPNASEEGEQGVVIDLIRETRQQKLHRTMSIVTIALAVGTLILSMMLYAGEIQLPNPDPLKLEWYPWLITSSTIVGVGGFSGMLFFNGLFNQAKNAITPTIQRAVWRIFKNNLPTQDTSTTPSTQGPSAVR